MDVARTGMTVVRAAQYVRMSTEHQQYSTENQSDAIREYAHKRGMEIVRTFADAGKSGLRLDGRDALKDLINVVQTGKADFACIIVYDVSRWGRFQDADESAYYEYICKRAGIQVIYCAEQFENDGSPVSTIVKGVKRAMAGEYSRELSTKVFKGQCRLIELGYRQGGTAGYGLRRRLIDAAGESKGQLTLGEQKSIHTDRVILVLGPPEEQAIVRRIYKAFIEDRRNEREIADELNRGEVLTERGGKWSRALVHEILTNEKYIGNNIFNRVSFKLKKKRVKNTPDMWVRRDEAFDPIIDPADYYTAQGMLLERHRKLSNDELLQKLRALYERVGRLSGMIITESEETPSPTVYRHRFGSLVRAYELVGYTPDRDYAFVEINRQLRRMHPTIVAETIAALEAIGGKVRRDVETDLLTINGEFTASLVLARCVRTEAGTHEWSIRLDTSLKPDITIVVRMDATHEGALDYYLLPSLDVRDPKVRLHDENGIFLDAFRFDTLDYFIGMAERAEVAA
ncbi:MAG: recombinase family protein [Polyangiales bacterium]